jgi:hypothetical protein
MAERAVTTIRAPQDWIDEVQEVADRLGVTRTAAILICTHLGIKILNMVQMTQEQFDRLLEGK